MLVGIPLDQSSFHLKYARPNEGNFAQSVGDADPDLAWEAYTTLLGGIPGVLDELVSLGVQVHSVLTSQSLAACMGCKVITIATQGKSAEFMPADVVEIDTLERALFGCIENHIQPRDRKIVDRLNKMLYSRMDPVGNGLGAATRTQLEYIRCRAEIEALYPGKLRGGAAIEFSDGFCSLAHVAAMFPSSFEGIVDLTICNSLALGEMIRRRCPNALAIATGDRTLPDLRLAFLLAVMKFLKRHPGNFDEAMTRMQDQFREGR